MAKRSESFARCERVGRKERRTRTQKIDLSDIPEASTEQLRAMRRVGRAPSANRRVSSLPFASIRE